jgi:ZIP family zinc transporter
MAWGAPRPTMMAGMPEVLILLLAACGTALATGLGAIPVFLLGERAKGLAPLLLGFAAGVMGVAAFVGLLIPAADEGSTAQVIAGLVIGIGFLVVARRRLGPDTGFMGHTGPGTRTSALVFLVLFVHSLPEGLSVGTAFASERTGLSLFVILAIAIQNIPEGTSVAIPMEEAGFGPARQFWTAVATSAPQPLGAVIAYFAVEKVSGLLPVSFAFAAGAMLALIVVEMLPRAYTPPSRAAPSVGIVAGAAVMLALSLVLGV